MKKLLTLLGLCGSLNASAEQKSPITEEFLDSIAMIESHFDFKAVGDKGKARGAYQMHKSAWDEAVLWSMLDNGNHDIKIEWSEYATEPNISRIVCKLYFKLLEYRFKNKMNRLPTALELYVCYNRGFTGAYRINFNADNGNYGRARYYLRNIR